MHPLFAKLTAPELASVRSAVITDVAARKNLTTSLSFVGVVALAIIGVFGVVGGLDETSTRVMIGIFLLPVVIIGVMMIVKAQQSAVLYALAGTGLTADEKRAVVDVLKRDDSVRAAVLAETQVFTLEATRQVGGAARRAVRKI